MNRLKSFQASEFPLGQSLFWWDSAFGNNNDNNNAQSTWDWLARDMTDSKRQRMYARLQMYKDMSNRPSWSMVFMGFNMVDKKKGMVNPFLGCPTAAEIIASGGGQPDNAELELWKQRLKIGKAPSVNLGVCLYCGDDAATVNNHAFVNYFTPLATQFFAPYVKFICICSEPPKNVNKQWQESVVGMVKTTLAFMGRSDIPVVTHLQGAQIQTDLPANADAVLYQFKGNPWNAHDRNTEDVKSEGAWALANCPAPLAFFELGVYCESDRIREQTRALRDLPGCGMLPGPM